MIGERDVIVVGAGVAGLTCARTVAAHGLAPLVLERDDRIGGRVRTDEVDGFLLDRGFQVLPVSYPEARRTLDLGRLHLGEFARGAIVRAGGRFRRVVDPRQSPLGGIRALAGGVIGVRDVAAIVKLRHGTAAETTALEALRSAGLSRAAVEHLFAPFLRGVFLEPRLTEPSRFLEFVIDTFASGPAALPEQGMGAIPAQLAEGLEIRTGAPVATVGPRGVSLEAGDSIHARAVVVATADLLDEAPSGWNGVSCVHFDAPAAPIPGPWLVVNGEGGPVDNLCVPSEVVPGYAPAGRSLVSVSVLGGEEPDLEALVRQLRGWFGAPVTGWRHLRTLCIPHALPAYPVGSRAEQPVRLAAGLYACGDHREHPSLNGAIASGRRAAEAVLADLAKAKPVAGLALGTT